MTRRRLVVGLLAAAVVAVAAGKLLGGDHGFVLKAEFADASGLRKDFFVKVGGVPVGKVVKVTLSKRDTAIVTMRIDRSALPIGRDARATIRPSSLLGEHHVEIDPGNRDDPAPSGTLFPLRRTSTAIELDQVLAALDEPTQAALAVFLSESGNSLVGRGHDFGEMLRRLPPTLEQASSFLNDLGRDNAALGRLVRDTDRVVAPLARERRSLGRFVETADLALRPLAERRGDLGASVAGGPDAIVRLRTTLRRLRSLGRGLPPAADGLRATAEPLRATLEGLTPFVRSARPMLRELRRASPALLRLGRREPTIRALRPVVSLLNETVHTFEPVSRFLDRRTPDILGFFEGYARSMHLSDRLGHLYNPQTVFYNLGDAAAAMGSGSRRQQRSERPPRPAEGSPPRRAARREPGRGPRRLRLPAVKQELHAPATPSTGDLLDYLLGR